MDSYIEAHGSDKGGIWISKEVGVIYVARRFSVSTPSERLFFISKMTPKSFSSNAWSNSYPRQFYQVQGHGICLCLTLEAIS